MLVLAVGALGLPGCAHQPAPPAVKPAARPAPTKRVTITGLIVNGVTSRPLVGAIIELDGIPRAESHPDGRFQIEEVTVGTHLLASRAPRFRPRIQPVAIIDANPDPDSGPRNDFIVLLFAPSAYFDTFPAFGASRPCKTNTDCPNAQICMMNNFKETDAPACTIPTACATETDCKLGQQCEPITLESGEEVRVCHGQPAPEVDP
jgi:hypothetical protein